MDESHLYSKQQQLSWVKKLLLRFGSQLDHPQSQFYFVPQPSWIGCCWGHGKISHLSCEIPSLDNSGMERLDEKKNKCKIQKRRPEKSETCHALSMSCVVSPFVFDSDVLCKSLIFKLQTPHQPLDKGFNGCVWEPREKKYLRHSISELCKLVRALSSKDENWSQYLIDISPSTILG